MSTFRCHVKFHWRCVCAFRFFSIVKKRCLFYSVVVCLFPFYFIDPIYLKKACTRARATHKRISRCSFQYCWPRANGNHLFCCYQKFDGLLLMVFVFISWWTKGSTGQFKFNPNVDSNRNVNILNCYTSFYFVTPNFNFSKLRFF